MASEEKREEKTNKDSISNKFADDPEMLEARVFIGNLKSSKVGSPWLDELVSSAILNKTDRPSERWR